MSALQQAFNLTCIIYFLKSFLLSYVICFLSGTTYTHVNKYEQGVSNHSLPLRQHITHVYVALLNNCSAFEQFFSMSVKFFGQIPIKIDDSYKIYFIFCTSNTATWQHSLYKHISDIKDFLHVDSVFCSCVL